MPKRRRTYEEEGEEEGNAGGEPSSSSTCPADAGCLDILVLKQEGEEEQMSLSLSPPGRRVAVANQAWDSTEPSGRARATELVRTSKPMMLVGSLLGAQPGGAARQLESLLELYQLQVDEGRYFLHKGPKADDSWRETCILDFVTRSRNLHLATSHLGSIGHQPTQWLTNSQHLAEELDRSACCERQPRPQALTRAIVKGMATQLENDVRDLQSVDKANLEASHVDMGGMAIDELTFLQEETIDDKALDLLAAEEDVITEAVDDVKGGPLNVEMVEVARLTELRYLWDRQVYRHASRREMQAAGGRAIKLKWIDTNSIRGIACTQHTEPD